MRRSRQIFVMLIVAFAAMSVVAPAKASLITETIGFTATDFTGFAVGPPIDPVIGSVTLTFDSAVAATDTSTGISLNSLNITLASGIGYDYFPVGSAFFPDELIIGGLVHDVNGIDAAFADFALVIGDATSKDPQFLQLAYSQPTAFTGIYETSTGSLKVQSSAVPEPGSLTLFASPLLMLILRRRLRAVAGLAFCGGFAPSGRSRVPT